MPVQTEPTFVIGTNGDLPLGKIERISVTGKNRWECLRFATFAEAWNEARRVSDENQKVLGWPISEIGGVGIYIEVDRAEFADEDGNYIHVCTFDENSVSALTVDGIIHVAPSENGPRLTLPVNGEGDPLCPLCGSDDLSMWADNGEDPQADHADCQRCTFATDLRVTR